MPRVALSRYARAVVRLAKPTPEFRAHVARGFCAPPLRAQHTQERTGLPLEDQLARYGRNNMRKIGSKKRFALIASTTAAVLIGSGVAVAYWTTTGSGTGTAATGTSSTVTVAPFGTAITGLYPGMATAVNVPFSITNSNVSGQYISTVALAVTSTQNGVTPQPGCTSADFTVTNATINAVVPSGTTNYATGNGATIKMIDTGVPQNLCKNVTVNLSFTAS